MRKSRHKRHTPRRPRPDVKRRYADLLKLTELAGLLRTEEGRATLRHFSSDDCESFGIPDGGWLFGRTDATPYAQAAEAALRRLASIRELPEPGTTASVVFNVPLPPPELTLHSDGILGRTRDFARDRLFPALEGRDIRRVKECAVPECKALFVALRTDQLACCHKHAKVMRMRRLRAAAHEYNTSRRLRRTGVKAVKGRERQMRVGLYEALRGNVE